MAQICKNCGAPLEEAAQFCGNCGAPQTLAQEPAQQTEYQQPQKWQHPEKGALKNKKKRIFLISSIAAGVSILAAVFFIFILPSMNGAGAGQNKIVLSEGGSDYYLAPYVFKLNGDGDPSLVPFEINGEARIGYKFYAPMLAQDGSTFYEYDRMNRTLNQATVTGSGTIRVEKWLGEEELSAAPFSAQVEGWYASVNHLETDGDYLYFSLLPGSEYRVNHGPINNKMGRISLKTKAIEEIPNISAGNYTLHDGWIYYVDNGFYIGETTGMYGRNDLNRLGIYKARTDGSGVTLLRKLTVSDESAYDIKVADELTYVGGKLYYLDYSDEGKGRVCSMSLSGGGVEYVSGEAAYRYAVDTDHSAVYYTVGEFRLGSVATSDGYKPSLRRFDCSSGKDEELPYLSYSSNQLTYHDGYVYFCNYSSFRYSMMAGAQPNSVCGMRLNVRTAQLQKLIGYNDGEIVREVDPATGRRVKVEKEGTDHLYWEDAEEARLTGE